MSGPIQEEKKKPLGSTLRPPPLALSHGRPTEIHDVLPLAYLRASETPSTVDIAVSYMPQLAPQKSMSDN